MSIRRFFSALSACLLLFAAFTPAQQKSVDPAKALEGFDDFVNQTIKDWHGAGAAVAIVQGDKVVLLKGYGYRDVEKKLHDAKIPLRHRQHYKIVHRHRPRHALR